MYKVAVIGLGKFGLKRLKTCLDLKNELSVVGIADVDPKICRYLTKEFKIKTYSNHKDLMSSSKPDLVIVSTPPKFHKEIILDCIRGGAHILCEKPLCLNSEDALAVSKASKKYGKFVKLGANHRFFANVKYALNLLKNQKIGEILNVRATIGNDGSLVKNSWFWEPDVSGGGTFIDNGSHVLDLLRQIMGDFKYCFSHMSNNFWSDTKVEDNATAVFITKEDKQAVVTSSWTKWYGYLNVEIWGSKGFILIDSDEKDIVVTGSNNHKSIKTLDFSNEPHNSYHQEILYFLDCINKKIQPCPNAGDGHEILKMIEAAYESNSKKRMSKI